MNTRRILNVLFGTEHKRLLATAVAALSTLSLASGASIGLKLGQTTDGNRQTNAPAVQPGDLAGAPDYAQVNWNTLGRWGANTTNEFGTNSYALLDSEGNNTHVSINWDATGVYRVEGGGTTTDQGYPDGNLMNPYADSNNGANVPLTDGLPNGIYGQAGANKPLVYLYGLQGWLATQSASQYDVVIYMDGDNQAGRTGEYWIQNASGPQTNITFGTDLTTHVFVRDQDNFTSTAVYQQVPLSSNNGRVALGGNYVVFTGMSANSFVIRTAEYNTRSGINAVQIVARTTPVGATIEPLPASQAFIGASASFRAQVGGVLPLSYQWKKNGVDLNDGGNISGANTATLTLSGVSAADVANYSLTVSNAGGVTTSTSAPLTVTAPSANSYAERVFTNNPVAYWRFNDTGDPSTNNSPAWDSVGGYNAIYGPLAQNGSWVIMGPQPPTYPGFDASNWALQTANNTATTFPYPSEYIGWAVAPALNLNTNTVTMCAWINPASVLQANNCGVIFQRGAGSDVCGFGYRQNNNLGYTWNGAATTYNFVSGLVPPSNQWSFVACVITPTNAILSLYNANGQLSATNAIVHTNAAFGGLTMIGTDPSSTTAPQNRGFTGVIDEVAVFNRALSAADLAGFYKKGLGLNVIKAVVTKGPQSLALMEGRPASFNVVASGDQPLTYQWRRNSVNLSDGGTISGANTPTLNISAVALGDAGSYDVVVQNVGGSAIGGPATLTVVAPTGTPTAYPASVMDANPIAYWRLNEPVSSPNAYDYWGGNIATHTATVVTGVDGPRPPGFLGMETSNAAAEYDGFSGAYTEAQVSLMNNRGQFSILGWFNAPYSDQPNRAGLFGQNDVCEFGFHGAVGSQTVGIWTPNGGAYLPVSNILPNQWYLAVAVGDGTNVSMYLASTNNGGSILQATSANNVTTNYGSSIYPFRIGGGGILDASDNLFGGQIDEVAVFNRALSTDEIADLLGAALVGGELPPVISIEPPEEVTIYAGQTLTLTTAAVGKNLNYQWRKGGVPISDAGNVSGTTTPVLTITDVTGANAGGYDLVVANNAGSVTSRLAQVTVIQPVPGSFEAVVATGDALAYYRLNEMDYPDGTTVAYDYVGGHNGLYGIATQNGAYGIAGPQPPDWLFESTNAAVLTTANTADSYVTAPFGTLATNTVTFAMWIYPMGVQANWSGLLVDRGGAAGGLNYNDQAMLGYTWNANSTWSFVSGLVIPTNQWSFVAMVIEPTQATLYLANADGYSSTNNVIAHTADVFGNTWRIGTDANNVNRTFNGVIDEVVVYKRSLSPAEIANLYSAGGGDAPVFVSLSIERMGTDVVLTWPSGTLLEADAITGPWTTNNATSPFTTSATGDQKYYRVLVE